jgi:hypothetical protein
MRLVIDPTNDPISRRYDQADSLGSRHFTSQLSPGENCSLNRDIVIDRAVSAGIAPGLTVSSGDTAEDIWT